MSAPIIRDPQTFARTPDNASEARLTALREEALARGSVEGFGITPADSPMPRASAQTGYYGIPLLKEPQWNPAIPVYFFVGGAAGAAAVFAEVARLTGQAPELVRDARTIAAAGSLLSPALLVADLGVPSRFLYMLRVFKLRSAMSVGVYIVTGFGNAAIAAKAAGLLNQRSPSAIFRAIEGAAGFAASLLGLGMATYTGVLIGATNIPAWNENIKTLPVHFAMSGMGAATSTLELMGHDRSRALNVLGMASAAIETIEGISIEINPRRANDPLKHGKSGAIVRAGGLLSGPLPLLFRIASVFAGEQTSRKLRRAAAFSSIAGSVLTRFGWVSAGHASARDYRLPLDID